MKIVVRSLSVVALLGLSHAAQAQFVVSYFNFNTLVNSANADVTTLTPNAGNGSLSETFNGSGTTAFGGSTINAQGADVAGQALALTGGSNGSGTPNNAAYLQLQINTVGYSGLTLSFATQKTANGFNSNQLSYSTNGGVSFTPVGSTYNPATSFALQSFDLSSVTALDNVSDVRLRLVFNGATSGSGNNRIDNLKVTAVVPAPSSALVLLFGAVPCVRMMLRRRKK